MSSFNDPCEAEFELLSPSLLANKLIRDSSYQFDDSSIDALKYIDTIHDYLHKANDRNFNHEDDKFYHTNTTMSSNLLRLFGEEKSFRIFDINEKRVRNLNGSEDADVKVADKIKIDIEEKEQGTDNGMAFYERGIVNNNSTRSSFSFRRDLDDSSDSEDFVEGNDLFEFIDTMQNGLQNLMDVNQSDFDNNYQMITNMSSNLMHLFGRKDDAKTEIKSASDWKPPKFFGLNNSPVLAKSWTYGHGHRTSQVNEGITLTNRSSNELISMADEDKEPSYKQSYDALEVRAHEWMKSREDSKHVSSSTELQLGYSAEDKESVGTGAGTDFDARNEFKHESYDDRVSEEYITDTDTEEGDDISEEEVDGDGDGDADSDDDSRDISTRANMSVTLMRALGMDVSGVEELPTDWKPPAHSGLNNSDRIL